MTLLTVLLGKLIPLYLIIALGYIASRFVGVDRSAIATLLVYVVAPVVIFHGAFTAPLETSYLTLPFLFYALSCALCLLVYRTMSRAWTDGTGEILAFTAGTGNTGYFGFPVAVALFGEKALAPMVLGSLGVLLYEVTLGFYITARGKFSAEAALRKLKRLPSAYAFSFGLLLNALGVRGGAAYKEIADRFLGCYVVLGMMLVGLGLAGLRRSSVDMKFISASFAARFVLWPGAVLGLLWVDSLTYNFYLPEIRNVMILLAIVPLAANTVAFATELKVQPEKAAVAVFLSTMAALVIIPLAAILLG